MPDQPAVKAPAKGEPEAPKTKSEATRARIISAALDLFRERGFEAATMREIASRAGVALGAAYYYFDSKDSIVLAFYDQAQSDMAPRIEKALSATKDLKVLLDRIISVKLEYFESSRAFLGALSGHADPEKPLSPFSPQTRAIRERDIEFFERALSAGRARIPEDLRPALPRILWMYQMGAVLFWIYDRSPEQRRTRALLDQSLRLVVTLIKLSGLPLMRPLRRLVIELVASITE